MRRQLVCASLIGALGWTPAVFGLGMGDIDSASSLNERFNARIPLRSVEDVDSNNIKVALASPEAFERAGLQRSAYLARLDFAVKQAEDGSFYVQVTSDEPIKEPFLNFLVRVRWPQGQLMREYTVLLDPPTYTDEPQRQLAGDSDRATEPAGSGSIGGEAADSRPAGSASGRPSGGSTSASGSTPGDYGPVTSNETLYRIANQVRPEGVTTNQAMIAMLRANPQAFIDDNINRLREGAQLDVPSRERMREISAGEAQREVEQQIAAWREQQQQQVASAGEAEADEAGAEASADEADGSGAGEGAAAEGELDIVGTDDASGEQAQTDPTSDGAGGSGEGASSEQLAQLEERVTVLEEENASLESQNKDLKKQVESLKEELAQKQAQLELQTQQPVGAASGEDGSGAEGELGESVDETTGEETASGEAASGDDESGTGSDTSGDDETAAGGEAQKPSDGGDADTTTESGSATSGSDESSKQPGSEDQVTFKDDSDSGQGAEQDDGGAAGSQDDTAGPGQDQETAASDQSSGGMLDWLVANLRGLAFGLAGLILAVLGVLWWLRRRNEASLEDEDELGPSTNVPSFDETPAGAASAGAAAGGGAHQESEAASTEPDDPMVQAQTYIDAGDLAQAQDVLDTALGTNPENKELRFKLLQVLAERGDRGGFEAEAQVLHTQLDSEDDPLWQSTVELGRQIAPEHPLFGEADDSGSTPAAGSSGAAAGAAAAGVAGAGAAEATEAPVSERSMEDQGSAEEPVPGAEPDSETDFDLSFDLDESDTGVTAAPAATADESAEQPATGDDDFELDFDFDSGAGTSTPAEEPAASSAPSASESDDGGLEFDLEFGDESSSETASSEPALGEQDASSGSGADLDFDLDFGDTESTASASEESTETASSGDDDLSFDLPDDLDLSLGDDNTSGSASSGTSASDSGGSDDLDLSFDDETTAAEPSGETASAGDEPGAGADEGDDLDSMDEVATKLDLAQAYLDMGDPEGAKGLLSEVVDEGDAQQKEQAQELLEKAG